MYNLRTQNTKDTNLGFVWTALIPLIPVATEIVVGLFKKKAPTLTQSQLDLLGRLPADLRENAVIELESVANMQKSFGEIFDKYYKIAVARLKSGGDGDKSGDVKPNYSWIYYVGGGALLLGTLFFVMKKRKK